MIGLILVLAIFGIIVSDQFGTVSNATNILEQSTALALVSLGQTLVIITGGIDLSVGSMVSLASRASVGHHERRSDHDVGCFGSDAWPSEFWSV